MLALTGVELFVILATAIVQMYCIKSLLDNRLIVWALINVYFVDKLFVLSLLSANSDLCHVWMYLYYHYLRMRAKKSL